ncbi:MAG TPA: hypothetical protein VMU87_16515 [Stellaceae bacterium]|nr:hypothetical protein [Stellaceae bacterium]
MADDPAIRRVVIVCDTGSDIRAAVIQGAELAVRFQASLYGIFHDDETLRRLAALPFGRQVSLSATELSEDVGDLAAISSALGAGMRRALEAAAAARGIEWSFGAVRDLASSTAFATGAGDMLVIEMHGREFAGAWGPHSQWRARLGAMSASVLIRGRRAMGRGVTVLLPGASAAQQKVLAAAAALAEDDDAVTILVPQAMAKDAAAAVAPYFAPKRGRPVRIEPLDDGLPALRRRVAALRPALVVLEAASAGEDDLRALVAETRCDVLLVR